MQAKPGTYTGGFYPRLQALQANLAVSRKEFNQPLPACATTSKAWDDATQRLAEALTHANKIQSEISKTAAITDPNLRKIVQQLWDAGQKANATTLDRYRQGLLKDLTTAAAKLAAALKAPALQRDQQSDLLARGCNQPAKTAAPAKAAVPPTKPEANPAPATENLGKDGGTGMEPSSARASDKPQDQNGGPRVATAKPASAAQEPSKPARTANCPDGSAECGQPAGAPGIGMPGIKPGAKPASAAAAALEARGSVGDSTCDESRRKREQTRIDELAADIQRQENDPLCRIPEN